MGGPEGPHTLAAEVVATQLAAWFELATFDWSILRVDELDEIPFLDRDGNQTGQAEPGPAFITRAEAGFSWSGGERQLRRLANPEHISRLIVFDTWTLNCDRHAPANARTGQMRKPNRDNVFLSEEAPAGQFLLKAMDHTHCFTCGREWTRRLSNVDTIQDDRIYGRFPEFTPFLQREIVMQAAADLATMTAETAWQMVHRIPTEWDVSSNVQTKLVELIVGRAAFVANTIESRLWRQGQLFRGDEVGDPS